MTCFHEPQWPYIVASAIVTYFGGLALLLIRLVIKNGCYVPRENTHVTSSNRKQFKTTSKSGLSCCSWIRSYANDLVAGETITSKLIIVAVLMMNLASVTLYVIDVADHEVNTCGQFLTNPRQQLDVILNAAFLIYFLIRLVAARDKLRFWIEINTFVDHSTIAPCFVSAYMGQNWIGFRYMRIMAIMAIPEVLQFLHILRHRAKIRMAQVVCSFCAIWWACSGFVHLIENMGDPWHGFSNGPGMTFWDSVYYLLVTMSTVGYGDISCKTDIGKFFILIFIVGSFVMFTRLIPEFVNTLNNPPKLSGHYSMVHGKRHIIVTGSYTIKSLKRFIKEFRQHKGHYEDTNIVIVDRIPADTTKRAFLRRHQWHVCHVIGSILDSQTRAAVRMDNAESVILLADHKSENPQDDDDSNIIRVAAVKRHNRDIRVILQLHDSRHKIHVSRIPGWDAENGDQIICSTQISRALLARACLCPGTATLITNLLNSSVPEKQADDTSLFEQYRQGAGMRLLSSFFSSAFYGLTFQEAVEYCYSNFGVILVGVDHTSSTSGARINPTGYDVVRFDTLGYFIAKDEKSVERIHTLSAKTMRSGKDCTTRVNMFRNAPVFSENVWSTPNSPHSSTSNTSRVELIRGDALQKYSTSVAVEYISSKNDQSNRKKDISPDRSFDYCSPRSFEDCNLANEESRKLFTDHVIIWILSDEDSPDMDISEMILSMRFLAHREDDFSDVIIVGDTDYIKTKWPSLDKLPGLYTYPITPIGEEDVEVLCLNLCTTCLVMSPRMCAISVDDKEIERDVILKSVALSSLLSKDSTNALDSIIDSGGCHTNRYKCGSNDVQMITSIESLDSLPYLEDHNEQSSLISSPDFASGKLFSPRALDCLIAGTYVCHQLPDVVMRLATGYSSGQRDSLKTDVESGGPSQLDLIPVSGNYISHLQTDGSYGSLFTHALRKLQMICIGLYRVEKHDTDAPCRRYVLSNPPADTEIISSDQVFCLRPYKMDDISQSSEVFGELNNVQNMLFEVCREMSNCSEITSL